MIDERDLSYTVEAWMYMDYGLKGNELSIFAIIYNFSKFGGENGWYGSLKKIERITGASAPTIISCYKKLEAKGMIKKEEIYVNGVKTCKYTALVGKKEKSRSADGTQANTSTIDNNYIAHTYTPDQGSCQSEADYYDSLADSWTDNEENEQVLPAQETLLETPEEPKQKKSAKYETEIKEVIDFLNAKTGGRHRPTNKQTIKDLTRWFKQGYKVEDIKRMISFKCNQWLNDQKMRDYLAPKTLFRLSNFEGYMEASQGYHDFVSDAERGFMNL